MSDVNGGSPRKRLVHVTTVDMSLELLLGPQLRAFRDAGYEVIGVSAPGRYVGQLEADGIAHVPLKHATRSFSLRSDVAAFVELYRVFRRLRPDIVHTHNPKPGVYGRIAAKLARVPLVVNTQHGLYAQPTDHWRKKAVVYALERIAAAFSDVELVQNEEDIATLRKLRVPAKKLKLLGNGVDLERFNPDRFDETDRAWARAELGASSDEDVVIGCVARLVEEKGIPELIEAYASLVAEFPLARLALIGPREDEHSLSMRAALAEAEALGAMVLGTRDDVDRLYCGIDLFVLASHREGFPRSAMEAAAMGLPIVATDVRGCRQVVLEGTTGRLVPARNAGLLTAALRQSVVDSVWRQSASASATQHARQHFDINRQVRLTLAAYNGGLVRPPYRTVLHVLPADKHRGAQRYARLLADSLNDDKEKHAVLTIYASAEGAAMPDICLGIPAVAAGSPSSHYRTTRRLREAIRSTRPAVLVVHGSEPLRYLGRFARGRTPVILLRVGTNSDMNRTTRLAHMMWVRRATAVVGVSAEALAAVDLLRYPRRRRREIIVNGRPSDIYSSRPRRTHRLPGLIWIGALDSGKRPDLFISAVADLRNRGLQFRATVVGEGPLWSALKEPAREAGVLMLGTRTDVPALLADHEILAFTARPPEGMPGVLIEAGLAGLPVVTTQVPGVRDVIDPQRTGIVVQSSSPSELASALGRLLLDDDLRARMGAQARERCVSSFSLETTLTKWRTVIDAVDASAS